MNTPNIFFIPTANNGTIPFHFLDSVDYGYNYHCSVEDHYEHLLCDESSFGQTDD